MTDRRHFPGAPGCECPVCRPHAQQEGGKQLSGAQALDGEHIFTHEQPTTAQGGAAPVPVVTDKAPFPPKRKEPPAHYLRQPQPWDGYSLERMELGGDRFTSFDNKVIGPGGR